MFLSFIGFLTPHLQAELASRRAELDKREEDLKVET